MDLTHVSELAVNELRHPLSAENSRQKALAALVSIRI